MSQLQFQRCVALSALVILALEGCLNSTKGGGGAAAGGDASSVAGNSAADCGEVSAGGVGGPEPGGGRAGSDGSGAVVGSDGGTGSVSDAGASSMPSAGAAGDGSDDSFHLGSLHLGAQQVDAFFYQGKPGVSKVVDTVGSCTVGLFISEGDVKTVSAGDITVTGGSAPLFLTPQYGGADNSFIGYSNLAVAFSPGDTVTFVGAGATVPPFSLSIDVPGPVGVTKPKFPQSGSFTLSRATDLVLEWAGADPSVTVSVAIVSLTSTTAPDVECSFSHTASGVIPAAALAYLPATPNPNAGNPDSQIIVSASSSRSIEVGVWTIAASATAGGVSVPTIVK